MNVYDFDNTIYKGESVFDFYIFCARRYPVMIRYIFVILFAWLRYKLLILSREKLMSLAEKYAAMFITSISDLEGLVKEFWDKNQRKIKKFYLETKRDDDVIVTASVGFLLREICRRVGIQNCICTEVDEKTGEIHKLCFRQNKPGYFKSEFPEAKIENFFSDSMNDLPMMQMAKNAYLVKGEKILPVAEEKLR